MISEPELRTFNQFIGQDAVKRELAAMIAARDNSNIIIRGNFGGGKTTLAKIYGHNFGNGYFTYQDTPEYFTNLNDNAATHIIDEIHLASKFEYLYEIMGEKTFIFCTTERQALPAPFVSRCVEIILQDYNDGDLEKIIKQRALYDGIKIDQASIKLIASRSRGVPRIAIQLLKRINNFAILDKKQLAIAYVENLLNGLRVYDNGLIEDDIYYLKTLMNSDRPVSINGLSAAINRNKEYVNDTIEPFLLRKQYAVVTARGRIITELGKSVLQKLEEKWI